MNLKKSMIRGLALLGASSMSTTGHANAQVLADIVNSHYSER